MFGFLFFVCISTAYQYTRMCMKVRFFFVCISTVEGVRFFCLFFCFLFVCSFVFYLFFYWDLPVCLSFFCLSRRNLFLLSDSDLCFVSLILISVYCIYVFVCLLICFLQKIVHWVMIHVPFFSWLCAHAYA